MENLEVKPTERLITLQILRAFAAWLVVFHHIAQAYYLPFGLPSNWFWNFVYTKGYLGVDLFFLLSGFVMAMSVDKKRILGRKFFFDRILRIVPAYWGATIILAVCILVLPNGAYNSALNFSIFWRSLLFIPHFNEAAQGIYPLLAVGWSLLFEMLFYLTMSAVIFCKLPKPGLISALVILVIIVMLNGWDILGHSNIYLVYFPIGILIYFLYSAIKSKGTTHLIQLTILSTAVFYFFYYYQDKNLYYLDRASYILYIGPALLGAPLLESRLHFGKITGILNHLGDLSYSTYIYHPIVIGWIYFLSKGLAKSTMLHTMDIAFILALTYVMSRWSTTYVEKSSALTKLRKILTQSRLS